MREKVFLVVETALWAELLRDRLKRSTRFEVVGIAGARHALRRIETLEPGPDVVLLDATSPLALETARRLRARDESLRLVVIALDVDPTLVLSWAVLGAAALVERSAPLSELLHTLTGVAHGESPCSPGVSAALLRGVADADSETLHLRPRSSLTRRQADVARLIATGMSNKEIAERLHIEPGTVKCHVHNVIRKLGVTRRAQVAATLLGDRGWARQADLRTDHDCDAGDAPGTRVLYPTGA